ncbi:zinc finger BED domain-containing protein 4-like [Ochlerotatus camptorhynchus]|uniref:zinc finger BED domain-containing protein 4-like n=1 Tax=Ochlerotatus camptorhynchus TaxID=644619 RepID=UPI0031DC8D6F
MVKRFLELYNFIQIIMSDQDRSSEMVKLEGKRYLDEVVKLLQLFNEVTEDLSGQDYATISRVLPIINCLNNCITAMKPVSSVGRNLQASLLREIQSRFENYRASPLYTLSVYGPGMFLDPRFKDVHFKSADERNAATKIIIHMVHPQVEGSDEEDFVGEEPPRKIPTDNGVLSYHEGMVQRYNNRRVTMRTPDSIRKEIDFYMRSGIESMTCDIFRYWEQQQSRFPFLYQVALKLLPRIATSVPSERLFSKTGRILSESRSSLDPERVNRIIFLHNVDASGF